MFCFLQVCDKPILSASVKYRGGLQNGWGDSISEKSGQPHDGVQEGCGAMQGYARCGCNLD